MTAIGRYGASQSGTVGWTNSPTTTPTTRASTAYTQQSPSVGHGKRFGHGVDVTVAGAVAAGLVGAPDARVAGEPVGPSVTCEPVVDEPVVDAGEPRDADPVEPSPCAYRNSGPEPAGNTMSCCAETSNWMPYNWANEENRPKPAEPTVRTCKADGSPMASMVIGQNTGRLSTRMDPPACRIELVGRNRTPPTVIASAPAAHRSLTSSWMSRSWMAPTPEVSLEFPWSMTIRSPGPRTAVDPLARSSSATVSNGPAAPRPACVDRSSSASADADAASSDWWVCARSMSSSRPDLAFSARG